jgi:C4-dicarboxylate-specific signal transduction histidine kinase
MATEETGKTSEHQSIIRLTRKLEERVKELDCLFAISDIVERSGGSLDRILEETAQILPPSGEHSEVAFGRIVLDDLEFRTPNYRDTPWTLVTELRVHGKKAGIVEVGYLEARPDQDDGPFSREERKLLSAVAERLGHVVERLGAERRLREAEEELRTRITHLTRVSTVGELASSIAHELNQPLTAVATYAQACRRMVETGTAGTGEVSEVLGRISEEALRAGEIIHRLRALVRKGRGQAVECDLNQLLRDVEPLASVDARMHDVNLRVGLEPGLPPVVADGIQVQQVVLNLIRNGVDAMEGVSPSGGELEVSTRSQNNREAVVSVTDHGSGLPEVAEDELFEPFFTTKESGIGMGLSISRSIVEAHGGRLWFSKNRDGGTTFSFTIPFAGEAGNE